MSLPIKNADSTGEATLDEVIEGVRAAPFGKEDFRRFLEGELSVENLDFYENVEEFRRKASDDNSSTDDALETEKQITDRFIVPGSPEEINIASDVRNNVVETVVKQNQFNPNVFDEAQAEVKNLMAMDAFSRFVKNAVTKNITKEHGDWRKTIGIRLFIIGFLVFGLFLGLQLGRVDPFDTRYWRILALPFLIGGFSYYISGKKCLCSGLAAAGRRMKEGEKQSWKEIFWGKIRGNNDVQDSYADRMLRWEGRKLTIKSIIYGTLLTIVLTLLPPGDDLYPSIDY